MKRPATIGQCIIRLRAVKGWTDAQLGQRCGLSKSFINDVENGRSKPSLDSLKKIFGAFNLETGIYIYKPGEVEHGKVVLIEQEQQK